MHPGTSILERLLNSSVGDMPIDYARRVLAFDFTPEEQARHVELAEKAQLGTLTEAEGIELDDLLTADDLLTILHAKAHLSLKQSSAA